MKESLNTNSSTREFLSPPMHWLAQCSVCTYTIKTMLKPVYIYSHLKQAIHRGLVTKNTVGVPEVLEQMAVHYSRPKGRADDPGRVHKLQPGQRAGPRARGCTHSPESTFSSYLPSAWINSGSRSCSQLFKIHAPRQKM